MNLEEMFLKSQAVRMRTGSMWVPPEQLAPMQEKRQQKMAEMAMTTADAAAGMLKGAVQGFAGLPGDVLAIGRGLYEIGARGGDESAADAFLKGLEEGLFLPTSEDIGKWLDKNVSPVVPKGQESRVSTEMRQTAAERGQLVGELAAPGGYIKGAKAAGRAVKKTAKAVKGASNGD